MTTMKQFLTARLSAVVLAAAVAGAFLTAPAQAADTYAQTRYPVVLVHGMFGFESIGPAKYFYGVPESLRSSGATVFTPTVSALDSNEVRGEQLLAQLRQLKAAYGHNRFNLIGHSQGGATIRYVAAVAPDLVASVTTVGAPHQGSVVSDFVIKVSAATGTTPLVASIFNALGAAISFISGTTPPQQSLSTLTSLSTAGATDFNRRFPQGAPTSVCGQGAGNVNGINYYSASGTSPVTNIFDPTDALMGLTATLFFGEPSDGLVSRCSSHWGTVLRDDYAWNHMDEINHTFGLRGLFASDPVSFYRSQANRLKLAGL